MLVLYYSCLLDCPLASHWIAFPQDWKHWLWQQVISKRSIENLCSMMFPWFYFWVKSQNRQNAITGFESCLKTQDYHLYSWKEIVGLLGIKKCSVLVFMACKKSALSPWENEWKNRQRRMTCRPAFGGSSQHRGQGRGSGALPKPLSRWVTSSVCWFPSARTEYVFLPLSATLKEKDHI